MKRSRIVCICLLLLSCVLALRIIAQSFGFQISMVLADIDTNTIEHLSYQYPDQGKETTVFTAHTNEGKLTLVQASKGFWGFWSIERQETIDEKDSRHISIMWVCDARWGTASHIYQPDYAYETHKVYCGADAKGTIEILPEQIPDGFTVNIQQDGAYYLIHVICFGDFEKGNDFDVWEVLLENGCIQN